MERLLAGYLFVMVFGSVAHADHCLPEFNLYQTQQLQASRDAKAALARDDMAAACEAARRAATAQQNVKRVHDKPGCVHGNWTPYSVTLDHVAKEICAVAAASPKPKPKSPEHCVSPTRRTNKDGTVCVLATNNCGYEVAVGFRQIGGRKGSGQIRTEHIGPGRTAKLCQVTLEGASHEYAGYCKGSDLQSRKCRFN